MARRKSNTALWVVLGVLGGGFLMVSVAVAGVIVLAASYQPHGTRIALKGDSELFYTKDVSKPEADKLAAFLNDKYVPADRRVSVQLAKPAGVHQVRFVIDESKVNDVDVPFLALGYLMSIDVFGNGPLEVHLCDANLKTLKTLEVKGKTGGETAKK